MTFLALSHTPASARLFESDLLQNKPKQARSNQRVAALLDATARVIHRSGYENMTTADVAEEAGASIGTVYRYFKDRVQLLEALAIRNFERTDARLNRAIEANPATVSDAIVSLFDMYVDLFRSEPGYRSLRLGDVLDIRPHRHLPWSHQAARTVSSLLNDKYATGDDERSVLTLERGFVLVDALLARAFFQSDKGDPEYIDAARTVAQDVARDFR